MRQRCFIGLMSGTSIDGIDAAAVCFDDSRPRLIDAIHHPYPAGLRSRLSSLLTDVTAPLKTILELDHDIGAAFADAAATLLRKLPPTIDVAAIGSHGQTVYHLPQGPSPNTLQLGNPNLIAERTGITTIADWRRRDMAAGGQGAPLAPAFHCACLRSDHDIAVLNLGGIGNLTIIPGWPSSLPPIGFDTGPANTLLDVWIDRCLGKSYDENGDWAATGRVEQGLLEQLLSDDYFSRPPPKSTGREYFNLHWLEEQIIRHGRRPAPADVAATLAELTARSVAKALEMPGRDYRPQILLTCGGGVHNRHLMERLTVNLRPITVETTAYSGIDPDLMEAMAFAWLAQQTLENRPIDTRPFTGAAGPRVLGAIYQA